MGESIKDRKNICLIFEQNNKADRDRLSGALRYAGRCPTMNVHLIDSTAADFRQLCRMQLSNLKLDGLICSNADLAEAVRSFATTSARFHAAVIDGLQEAAAGDITIELDTRQIFNHVIDLFLRRGYRAVAFVGTSARNELLWSGKYETVFRQIAVRKTRFIGSFNVSQGNSFAAELEKLARWVETLPKPCGVMAYSDELARVLLDACHIAKVNVPEAVAIIGMDDDISICESCRPTLTSILPDFELSGFYAAMLLDRAISGRRKAPTRKTYGLKRFVERFSTIDPRGAGRIISAARKIIDTSVLRKDFCVAQLARRLNVSTRILEISFKKIVGHSPKSEISRIRLETLKDQLGKSSLPISTLAETCGFNTLNAANVAFKKRYGMSMRDWRNDNP